MSSHILRASSPLASFILPARSRSLRRTTSTLLCSPSSSSFSSSSCSHSSLSPPPESREAPPHLPTSSNSPPPIESSRHPAPVAAARDTAGPTISRRRGRRRSASASGSASASASRSSKRGLISSLRAQAAADLAMDVVMIRSADEYKQRHLTGAPALIITAGAQKDIPRFGGSKKQARSAEGKVESPPSDARPTTNGEEEPASPSNLTMEEVDEALHAVQSATSPPESAQASSSSSSSPASRISARDVKIREVVPLRGMKIAKLRRSLGRVLFNPGVQTLRDSRSGVWNFDPSLHDIPKPNKFAFHRCPQYITPSEDEELLQLAERNECRFLGSTSTLTKALSQIYFAMSGGKGVDLSALSQHFAAEKTTFTPGAELPASIILNPLPQGRYSVDSDKRWDIENVISDFGRILEKMLTSEAKDFQRFLTSSPESAVPESERTEREAYRYQRAGSLLMRSQLDCYDPRLPGSGVFDIKTRACLPIRYDRANYVANSAYDIWKEKGYTESYEREYYDLLRAGMLKFSLQVRIGGMDGIFLAYHNTSRLFGFQYVSLSEMDERLFGSSEMADQAFKLSVTLLEDMLQRSIAVFPDQAVNVVVKHTPAKNIHSVTAYVEPKEWADKETLRPARAITFTMENLLDDEPIQGPVAFSSNEDVRKAQNWSIKYTVSETSMDEKGQKEARLGLRSLRKDLMAMTSLVVPAGQTVESMRRRDWKARRREQKARVGEASAEKTEAGHAEEQGQAPESSEAEAPSAPSSTLASTPTPTPTPTEDGPFLRVRWVEPGKRQRRLRAEAAESGRAYLKRKGTWKEGVFAWSL